MIYVVGMSGCAWVHLCMWGVSHQWMVHTRTLYPRVARIHLLTRISNSSSSNLSTSSEILCHTQLWAAYLSSGTIRCEACFSVQPHWVRMDPCTGWLWCKGRLKLEEHCAVASRWGLSAVSCFCIFFELSVENYLSKILITLEAQYDLSLPSSIVLTEDLAKALVAGVLLPLGTSMKLL